MTQITIIGGGIAGLTTAFYLQKFMSEKNCPLTCNVMEMSDDVGGKIVTKKFDNFTVEGGPDSFITRKQSVLDLCRDLDIEDKQIPINSYNDFHILSQNKLVPLSQGLYSGIPESLESVYEMTALSFAGKVQMMADIFLPPRLLEQDENLADFLKRHFGNEAFETIYAPIMAGIYGASPEKLSIHSLYPQLVELERKHGSLINSIAQLKGKSVSKNPVFKSFKNGMHELIESLTNQLDCDIKTNMQIVTIKKTQSGYDIVDSKNQRHHADAVVLATPACNTTEIIADISDNLAQLLNKIHYTSSATITLGYKLSDLPASLDLHSSGFLIPFKQNRNIMGCALASRKFNYRAPKDVLLIRAFIGGPEKSHLVSLPEDELLNLVNKELSDILKINCDPLFHKLFRWHNGNPQYEVGHRDWLSSLNSVLSRLPGIYLTGSSYYGIGIPDCVHHAKITAEKIASDLF